LIESTEYRKVWEDGGGKFLIRYKGNRVGDKASIGYDEEWRITTIRGWIIVGAGEFEEIEDC
jgi:hypothetical protein